MKKVLVLGSLRVLSCKVVSAIGTPAITLLLRTSRMIKEAGGTIVFANAPPNVHGVFICCRLDLVLNLASTVSAALEILRLGQPEPLLAAFAPSAELAESLL